MYNVRKVLPTLVQFPAHIKFLAASLLRRFPGCYGDRSREWHQKIQDSCHFGFQFQIISLKIVYVRPDRMWNILSPYFSNLGLLLYKHTRASWIPIEKGKFSQFKKLR